MSPTPIQAFGCAHPSSLVITELPDGEVSANDLSSQGKFSDAMVSRTPTDHHQPAEQQQQQKIAAAAGAIQ